ADRADGHLRLGVQRLGRHGGPGLPDRDGGVDVHRRLLRPDGQGVGSALIRRSSHYQGERDMTVYQADGPRLAPIVCGIDDRYLRPLGALMRSLAATHSEDRRQLRLIVLHRGLSAAAGAWIGEEGAGLGLVVQIREVPDRAWLRYPVSGWVSEAVYLRLAVAEALPDEPR